MNYSFSLKTLSAISITVCYASVTAKTIDDIKEKGNAVAIPQHCLIKDSSYLKKARSLRKPNTVKDAIYLEADTGNIQPESTSTLNGNVVIQQNTTVFTADNAQINRQTNQVTAQGNVVLSDTNVLLESPLIEYNLENRTGTINDAKYALGTEGARGESSQIKQLDENNLSLTDATFTSCPVSEESWHFASEKIKLNKETQIGTAKNVTLKVGTVPIFYFPWLRFPINNQRLSGFLSPSIKLQTNAGVTIPYYFNLAPNYDATVSLTTLESRGFQIGTEFRYLTNNHKGELDYDLIPRDKSFDDDIRYHFNINHQTDINDKTKLNVDAEGVSDEEYFDDFSSSLETSTVTSLKRRLELSHKDTPWTASATLEDYQILDNDDQYSKLPELKLSYAPKVGPKDLKLELNSELIYFDKENDVTGTRADAQIKLSKKWGNDSWFFKPTLGLEHTLYSLDNTIGETSISRTLPTITLDGGLFFDREISNQNKNTNSYTQTLEPRIFYTHTPFRDQSNIPIFDTALTDFSESNQLFLENRFTGKDRIADTNQLTFAVSSRIQDRNNGKEIFKATIGQIYNFSDRKVTLPGGTILTGKRSDLLLDLTGRINDNLRLGSTINLKSDEKGISSYGLRLNYQDEKKRIANLSFRKIDTELEQVSFSTALPINDKWSMVASTDHDTENDRNLESLVGFEYQDCCWKTRVVVKRFLTSDNENYETPVFIEFELKGLGKLGKSATSEIKDNIYGYDDF